MSSNAGGITNIDGNGEEDPNSLTTLSSGLSALRKDRKNTDILDHKKLREIEGKVYALQDRLEDQGRLGDAEVQKRCDELRQQLTGKLEVENSKSKNSDVRALWVMSCLGDIALL